ncbi:GNAT family N-acetyltransferase [Oceanobacillus halophilus]|uniref:N-acetyltransferase n=1 Tax=Oceanobacillus halophilus TaxID=930130 RepID=A0A494ZXH7_9BACI|nr:GNAT family N-acetyltransferase [Oceanobacillus halophilus]RKQ31399.1 N-acetyltransferase [Oceanobacillus halophilus]
MLKNRELHEVPVLYELMSHPEVFPYVRHKANSADEFYFITKKTIEAEENRELISRTILDEYYHPIGTINLFDIEDNHGFLATWIGQPYFGKGYNKPAKEEFFDELFFSENIEGIFMKVRKANTRSLKAALKLPYVALANTTYPEVFNKINETEDIYDLFVITKEHYAAYKQFANTEITSTGEEVS